MATSSKCLGRVVRREFCSCHPHTSLKSAHLTTLSSVSDSNRIATSRTVSDSYHSSSRQLSRSYQTANSQPSSQISSSQISLASPSPPRPRKSHQTPRSNHKSNTLQRRTYFSVAEPQVSPHSDAENAILSAALARVPSHGFTTDALTLGATDVGYLPASTNLFPRGAFEIVMFHLVRERLTLKDRVQFPSRQSQTHSHNPSPSQNPSPPQGQPQSKAQVEANLNALILARLHANTPYISRLNEALALISLPSHIPASVAELSRLADEILYLSGDTSVDSSWYTKRAGVSGVYASAELFMTQDTSVEFKATEAFVARRLEEMHSIGGAVGDVGEWVKFQGLGAVNVLRSWGVRI